MFKSKRWFPAAVLLSCAFSRLNAQNISPPWFTLWNQIVNTVGDDPTVVVQPLDDRSSPMVVTIRVPAAKAQAMASILRPRFNFGNIDVVVRVVDESGVAVLPTSMTAAQDVIRALNTAFASNRLFVGAFGSPTPLSAETVGVLFTRSVVQFFNDDISELYNNFNAVTAAVFRELLLPSHGNAFLLFGTQKPGPIPQLIN